MLGRPIPVPEAGEVRPHGALSLDSPRLEKRFDELAIPQGEIRQRPLLPGHEMRVVQGAPQDEPRNGVDVRCGYLAPEPHGFEGNRSAPRERIEHLGRAPAERLANFLSKPRQLGRRLAAPTKNTAGRLFLLAPLCRLLDGTAANPKQQFPAAIAPGIVEQRRQQHRTARGKGPPRRPDMQRGDVAVADVLLVHRVDGRLLQRKPRLDQAAAGAPITHRDALCRVAPRNRETIDIPAAPLYRAAT